MAEVTVTKSVRMLAMTGVAWGAALTMVSPILFMALTALKSDVDANRTPFRVSFTPTLGELASLFGDVGIMRPLLNSVFDSIGATLLCFLFALPTAYALAFHTERGRTSILLGMLATRFIPGIGMAVPVYLIFKTVGLIDTQVGLASVHALLNLPIVTLMAYSFMRDVPREILDSARIDGATTWQRLVLLVLPLCRPGLCSAALLSIVLCWNEAFWSIQVTSSGGAPLSSYMATLSGDPSLARLSAASLIAIAPVMFVGWLAQRNLARGLTFGAVR